jgi:muramidase (phage lysozyme)
LDQRALNTQRLQDPRWQSLLATIRFAEGTAGPKGYNTFFGGGTFDDFSRHPDVVKKTPGYESAAAGAGQFLPKTWAGVQKALGSKSFSPEEQDRGMAYLAYQRKADPSGGFTPQLAANLAPEWASFPTLSGKSYYGQPVKRFEELRDFYDRDLASRQKGGGGLVDIASARGSGIRAGAGAATRALGRPGAGAPAASGPTASPATGGTPMPVPSGGGDEPMLMPTPMAPMMPSLVTPMAPAPMGSQPAAADATPMMKALPPPQMEGFGGRRFAGRGLLEAMGLA